MSVRTGNASPVRSEYAKRVHRRQLRLAAARERRHTFANKMAALQTTSSEPIQPQAVFGLGFGFGQKGGKTKAKARKKSAARGGTGWHPKPYSVSFEVLGYVVESEHTGANATDIARQMGKTRNAVQVELSLLCRARLVFTHEKGTGIFNATARGRDWFESVDGEPDGRWMLPPAIAHARRG